MALSSKQKTLLKKNVKQKSFSDVCAGIGISEKEAKKYLLRIWGNKKTNKFLHRHTSINYSKSKDSNNNLLKEIKENKVLIAILSAIIFLIYANSINNEFVSDDIGTIVTNPNINSIKIAFDGWILNIRSLGIYITHLFFKETPAFYRIQNIVFHILNSIGIFILVLKIFKNKLIAAFSSFLFAVHPLQTESVIWISGGPYSWGTSFCLWSLIFYTFSNDKFKMKGVSLIMYYIALSLWNQAIVLFPIFMTLEFSNGNIKKNWKKLIPYLLIFLVMFAHRLGNVQERKGVLGIIDTESAYNVNPIARVTVATTEYLKIIIWPKYLTLYHTELSFTKNTYIFRAIILIMYIGTLVYSLIKNKKIFFWLSLYLVSLSPSLTSFTASWVVAERYAYMASIGIYVSFAYLLIKIIKKKEIIYIILIILLIPLSIRTVVRNRDWKDQDTLWLATAKTSPSSPQNHNNLGDLYGRRGDNQKAIEEFKKAIELKPGYGDAYHNLANTYQQIEKKDLAIENFTKAIEYNPNLWQSYQNLAIIYLERKNFNEAVTLMEKAVGVNPNDANLRIDFGIALISASEEERAKEQILKALELDPQNERAQSFFQKP